MKNLYTRTITGVFFIAIIIGSMIWHPLAFIIVAFFLTIIGMLEFYRLVHEQEIYPQKVTGIAAGSIIFLLPSLASLLLICPVGVRRDWRAAFAKPILQGMGA